MQTFWRELPHLLGKRNRTARWVCYHGEERVGIGTYEHLLRECLRLRIRDDEYYLARIRPRELPPWEPEEVEALGPQHLEDYPSAM